MSECARIAANNTANGFGGSTITMSFGDFICSVGKKDNRTAEEIVKDVAKRAGLEVING